MIDYTLPVCATGKFRLGYGGMIDQLGNRFTDIISSQGMSNIMQNTIFKKELC